MRRAGFHHKCIAALFATLLVVPFWSANLARSASKGAAAATAKQAQSKTAVAPSSTPNVDADATKKAEALKTRKNLLLLDDAHRLQSEGSNALAQQAIVAVLKDTSDEKVVDKAKELLENNQPTTLAKLGLSQAILLKTASWWIDIVLGILILLALYAILRGARFVRSVTRRGTWRLDRVSETPGLGAADLIIESLGRWDSNTPSLTSGLLKLERLQLPSIDWLKLAPASLDLADALKDLSVTVGGNLVKLSGIASAGKGIREWLNATSPTIEGKAIVSGSNLMVTLTARSADRNFTVTESRRGKPAGADPGAVPALSPTWTIASSPMPSTSPFSPDDIQGAAQAASYKIFYLISRAGSTLPEAEAANSLREGLNQLWEHVSTQNPDKLEQASEAFRQARTRRDDFYEAYLYEGIALDLLSQHDEAIKRFEYLENEKRMRDRTLREKAIYNQAISLFRKYQYPTTRRAEAVLDRLIAEIPDAAAVSQIKSMALAAKASVVAQYPMYWTVLAPESEESPISELERRKKIEDAVTYWIGEVAKLREGLERILETVKREGEWDRGTERQLEWAINNAWGSVHLNSAIYVYSSPDPEHDPPEWRKKRSEYLNTAYEAFQNCAMLLTPGVENLTNLAKVTFELGRFAQGCAYLEQVRKMNPSYEYAYFRLAKEWDKRHETARVVKILKSFQETQRTPVIP